MADTHQPETARPRLESTEETLTRLIAESGLSHRKIAKATEATDRKLGASSIGNIARGDDRASAETLAHLAGVLGRDPHEFIAVRLARTRRLFDEREERDGGVGLQAAAENYELLAAFYPHLTEVRARLLESVELDADDDFEAATAGAKIRQAVRARAPDASSPGAPQPPAEEQPPKRAARRRSRRS